MENREGRKQREEQIPIKKLRKKPAHRQREGLLWAAAGGAVRNSRAEADKRVKYLLCQAEQS
ncbi:MAG: hypothetical protein ACLSHP_00840 [Coprococcus sp.]